MAFGLCAKQLQPRKEKAMSYGIAISFAAAAIGISCIATDASARAGGGGGKPSPQVVTGVSSTGGANGGGGAAAGARYYVPASYNSNNTTACGRYPYPPCKKVPAR